MLLFFLFSIFSNCMFATNTRAKVFEINSPNDDLMCDITTCSLRGAIQTANTNSEIDTIIIPAAIYKIKINSELLLKHDSINDGVDITIIGDVTIDAQKKDRVFAVTKGTHAVLNGLDITGGYLSTSSSLQGAGIYNQGTLEINNVKIYNNVIKYQAGKKKKTLVGAGIYNGSGATLSIVQSEIGPRNIVDITGSNGTARGAGIYSAGSLSLIDSSVYNNYAFAHSDGSKGSHAQTEGGGIFIGSSSAATITNSTISSNSATSYGNSGGFAFANGGGIYAGAYSQTLLANVTVAENIVNVPTAPYQDGTATGHAFFVVSVPKTIFKIKNSIITSSGKNCIYPIQSDGYNIISDTSCFKPNAGDQITAPQLLPLGANGGPTKTHALSILSPAVDAGNKNGCLNYDNKLLLFDQRGKARPEKGCDSGAFEI